MQGNNKPQRSRKKPVRTWSDEQRKSLVNFLRDNVPIEKPSARIYYQRFQQLTKIPIEWELVRMKVRNMRVRFTQVKEWKDSNEAQSMSEEHRRARIIKMCSFYDEFEEISKQQEMSMRSNELSILKRCMSTEMPLRSQVEQSSPRNTISSGIGGSDVDQAEKERPHEFIEVKVEGEFSQSQSTNISMNNLNEMSDSSYGDNTLNDDYQDNTNKPPLITDHPYNWGLQDETDGSNINRIKRSEKWQLKEKKLALKIEQFYFEKEKFTKQQELRKWELESQERIRKLELEMQERIAMRELHIKEQFANKKFKRKRARSKLLKH